MRRLGFSYHPAHIEVRAETVWAKASSRVVTETRPSYIPNVSV